MRKITELAVAAFLNSESFRLANTSVHFELEASTRGTDMVYLKLHGNTIARKSVRTGIIEITTSGWGTPTTKSRLNGLPGVSVYTRKGELMLNGEPWNGEWAVITTQNWTHSNPTPSSWTPSADYYGSPAYRAICDDATM